MNPFIQKALNMTSVPYSYQDETTIIFDKQGKLEPIIGHYYIVKFENYIIHPYEGFTLHDNYNNGIVPKCEYMEIELLEVMGKLYKINGVGYDPETGLELLNERWTGYVPEKGIKFLREVF